MTTARSPSSTAASDMARLLAAVRAVVLDVSDGRGLGLVTPDVSFERELGLGSLERVELAIRAGDAFGVQLSEEAFSTADTPRQLLAFLQAQSYDAKTPVVSCTGAARAALLPGPSSVPPPADAATLVDILTYHVRTQPDRVHIVLEDDDGSAIPITYAALYRAATAVGQGLRAHGLVRGRTVAIMLPTSLGYFATFLGVLLAGGVPVPLYPPMRLDRIAEYIGRCTKILTNADAQILVTFDRAARVADIARDRVTSIEHVLAVDALLANDGRVPVQVDVEASDTALIQYTSGSTGDPKGVELTHANVVANIRAATEGCGLVPEDVVVSWLPLYHDMGLIGGWLMPFYAGVPTVIMSPLAFLSRPIRWLGALSDYRATCSVSPNFAFDLCVKRIDAATAVGLHLGQVRAVLNGSEPILPATLDRFVARFAASGLRREAIFCAYGLVENMVAVTFPPVLRAPRVDRIDRAAFEAEGRAVPTEREAEALEFVGVGSAVPGHEIAVVDDEAVAVPERVRGNIRFRGPSSFKGYFRRPDATAEVKQPDGWVDTGDLGYIADGELFIVGRSKDLIIKGGRNYHPHEIEEAAATVPGIRQGCVAAFADPDPENGTEQIVVLAETRERDRQARDLLVAHVIEAVSARVGVPPDRVVLCRPGVVPKTSSGKIQRRESKRIYLAGELDAGRASFARQVFGLYLASLPTRITAAARAAARGLYGIWAACAIASVIGVALAVGHVIPGGRAARRFARTMSRLAMRLAGLLPRTIGVERLPPGPAILVANHSGYLDFLICAAALPSGIRFVIKAELRRSRLLGPVLQKVGHVFIDRHSTSNALADLDGIVELVRAGERVVVFPEGTFCPEIGLRPFKLGAFRLACEAGAPIVPIAIRGSRRALRDDTYLPRHARIDVEVLDAIAPDGAQIADVVRLRDRAADEIAAHLDEPRLFAANIALRRGPGE